MNNYKASPCINASQGKKQNTTNTLETCSMNDLPRLQSHPCYSLPPEVTSLHTLNDNYILAYLTATAKSLQSCPTL